MLQPRNFLRCRQYVAPVNVLFPLRRDISASRQVFQDNKNASKALFIPNTSAANLKPSFKQSPSLSSQDKTLDNTVFGSKSSTISIDNFYHVGRLSLLPQTGTLSGRTVSCSRGKVAAALSELGKIVRENNIQEEHRKSKQRYKPSTARRMLRSKRHRKRFKQGIARLVEIVLKMKKKSF